MLGCAKTETNVAGPEPSTKQNVLSRTATPELIAALAADSALTEWVKTYFNLVILVARDSAMADSAGAAQLFGAYGSLEVLSIAGLDSMLMIYHFFKKDSILAVANRLLHLRENVLQPSPVLNTLTEQERAAALNAAVSVIISDWLTGENLQPQTGDCCKAYKAALIKCAEEAMNYISSAWYSRVYTGPLFLIANPVPVIQRAFACIRAADAQYTPCCKNN